MGVFNNLFFVLRRNATGIVRPSAHSQPLGQCSGLAGVVI
jgi:hypothetical protein